MNLEREFRLHELTKIMDLFPHAGRILEIGAGAGWQSEALTNAGYRVTAIDLQHTAYRSVQCRSIVQYDGTRMPFADGRFACLFSSNVLEHVTDLEAFQVEALRVVDPKGVAIHLMPSATWRFWTFLAHYLYLGKQLLLRLLRLADFTADKSDARGFEEKLSSYGKREIFRRIVLPDRHGEVGNVFSEVFHFSRFRWRAHFRRSDWSLVGIRPTRLFYTGYALTGRRLSLRVRYFLSFVLGSSCLIYIARPGSTSNGGESKV